MLAERAPQPRRLDQQLEADLRLELGVLGGVDVTADRGGDVGVDVERGGPRGPVAGALPRPPDRPPRKRRPGQAQVGRVLLGLGQHQVPPAQGVGRGGRLGVREHGQHVRLGIPRTCARRSRCRSGPWPRSAGTRPTRRPAGCGTARSARPAGSRRHRRPRRRRRPRTRPGSPAARPAGRPSRSGGRRPRADNLVNEGGPGPLARPAVADVLHDAQPLARGQFGRRRERPGPGRTRSGCSSSPGR